MVCIGENPAYIAVLHTSITNQRFGCIFRRN